MNTSEEELNASEERIFQSFQAVKLYLKNTSNPNKKIYKRKDKLIILSKKLSRGLYSEEREYFSKNELKIMNIYRDINDESINGLDGTTQAIYDYIVEYMENNKKNVCLCELNECCRKCCVHPETTCIWKNYVEADEWNDPDNVWFGSLKGIHY
jgi:hypothetical protein